MNEKRPQEENDAISLQRLQQGLNDLMEAMWSKIGTQHEAVSGKAFSPQAEQSEWKNALEIVIDLPGVKEEDIEITAGADRITVRGERREVRDRQEAEYHISERSYGVFRRVFELPTEFDGGKAKASLEQGVLTITVPKKPGWDKAQKKIAISSAPKSGSAPKTRASKKK